jgi:hypothetical protein
VRANELLRQQLERFAVVGAYRAEVAAVESRHGGRAETLGKGDHGGVDAAKWRVGVKLDQLGDPLEVLIALLAKLRPVR